MNFLYPSFLWALSALSVPIIIHLFNFRRIKKVYFTNVAFLKVVETQTNSFRKLKQWLILATRVLFLAFLVLAFAQPFIPAKNQSGKNMSGLNSFYLDNSLSMQNINNKKRHLDEAITKINDLFSVFPKSANLQLLTNDFSEDEQHLSTAEKLKDRLASIKFSALSRNLPAIYKRQISLLNRHHGSNNQLFWFSDFQKSTAGDLNKLKIDSTNQLFIVPVQSQETPNVFVDSVWLATPFIREMQNNVLFAKLSNAGNKAVEKLPIRLYIDETQSSTASASIGAKSSAVAKFNFTVRGKGFKKGKVTFDDSPITFDNDYYFVLNASPSIQVLHLYQQKNSGNYIEKVFANDSLFNFNSFSALNVDVGRFKNANLVILEGIERIDGSFKTALDTFIQQGGSILVLPAAKIDATSYNSFLNVFGVSGIVANNMVIQAQNQSSLAEPSKNSPFFADVFEHGMQQGVPNTPNAQAVLNWNGVGEKLLSFRNGQTFLSQTQNTGGGKIYLCASPLDQTYGNFAQHALFVPVMYKMAALSVKQQRTAFGFDEGNMTLDVQNPTANAVFKLKKDKIELIPVQNLNGNQLNIEIPKSEQLADNQQLESGYYELMNENKTVQLLAFNHDNKESNMDFYTADELKSIFSGKQNVQIFDNLQDDGFVKTFQESNFGTPLWKDCILLALLFLLAEILIIRFLKG